VDWSHQDKLTAALKRLHKKGCLELRQWLMGATGYAAYAGADDFFYRNGFEMKITAEGYPYFEELQEQGDETRRRLKAYLDNDVVSAFAKADMPPGTLQALKALLELFSQEKVELVTSDLSKREIDRMPEGIPNKWHLDVIVGLLKKVPFVEDHELRGFQSHWDRFGGTSSPLIEDDPIASDLRGVGLHRADAHHVMLAIRAGCDVFVTCDKRTILNRRAEIERRFSIQLESPEEFVSRFK